MIIAQQNNLNGRGNLLVEVTERQQKTPIEDAKLVLSFSGEPDSTVEEISTDESGQSQIENLLAPPVELSLEPGEIQPYSQYTLQVQAPGYHPLNISGIQVFSQQTSIQQVVLQREEAEPLRENVVIPENTLYGNFPPKIAETEIKPINESGEIVLSRVVIPEFIIVHDGAPTDTTASDYYVPYADYIKMVASAEIYSTWPKETLKSNILAIMSFTLNRVYTEW